MKKEMLDLLMELRSQGVYIYIADDGWDVIIKMLSNRVSEISETNNGDDEAGALAVV